MDTTAHLRTRSTRFRGVVALTLLVVTLLVGAPPPAPSHALPNLPPTGPGFGIDLAPMRVYNASQVDSRWAATKMIGPAGVDRYIGGCGCLLATMTAMIWHHLHAAPDIYGTEPWSPQPHFPTRVNDYDVLVDAGLFRTRVVVSSHEQNIFSPHYLDRYLREGPPGAGKPANWGYAIKGDIGCGVPIQPWALEHVAVPNPIQLPDGRVVGAGMDGVGFTYHQGLRSDVIDANLAQGRPTLVGHERLNPDGTVAGRHMNIVTGWDAEKGQYRFLDPVWVTGASSYTPFDDEAYSKWYGSIIATVDVYPTAGDSHLVMSDDPSPIELSAVLPDGRLVGYDPETGEQRSWQGHSAYALPHFDLTGDRSTDIAPIKGLMTTNPEPGVTRTRILGTGSGTYSVDLLDIDPDGTEHALGTVAGTTAAGQEVKHEVTYDEAGNATAVAVDNWTPEPVLEPVVAVAGEAVELDATGSFDADGEVTGFAWDLGDGGTATGATTTHTWDRPGTYPVTVTVTDDGGATRSETVDVVVEPSELDAPTIEVATTPSAAVDGWVSADSVTVSASAADAGSGVASITTGAEGADPTPERTEPADEAEVVVDAEGRTTVRAVAHDAMGNVSDAELVDVGIDRTPPTAVVRSPRSGDVVRSLSYLSGTADDAAAGVDTTEVSLRRSDGRSWDGSAWVDGQRWLPAVGGWGWHLSEDLPAGADLPDGTYTVSARATDAAGNVGPPSAERAVTVQAAHTGGGGLPIVELAPEDDHLVTEGFAVTAEGRAVGVGITGAFAEDALRWDGGAPSAFPPLPGHARARATGVDSLGRTAVGWSVNSIGQQRATAWVDGAPVDLGTYGDGRTSEAEDVNDAGVVVGSSAVSSLNSQTRAARFSGGSVALIDDLGGTSSRAFAVNDDGDVVGYSSTASDSGDHAFFTPAGGQAVALPEPPAHPDDPDAFTSSYAYDVNDTDQVVGSAGGSAVRWQDGAATVLGPDAVALGIDDAGTAVGVRYDDAGETAVLWEGGAQADLDDLVGDPAWHLERAEGISDDGRFVVGIGTHEGLRRGFVVDLAGGGPGGGGGDTVAPSTTAAAPEGWSRGPVDVGLTATDEGGGGVASIAHDHGDPIEAASGTVRVAAEGVTTLTFAATDGAGNTEAPPGQATVRIDTVPPRAEVAAPAAPASGWHREPVTVAVDGSDSGSGLGSLTWTVDGVASTGGPGPVRISGNGSHRVSVVADDVAGNRSATATATVQVDGTAPELVLHGLDEGTVVEQGRPLLVAADDPASGVADLSLFVTTPTGGRRPAQPGELLNAPGPTTLEVSATDVAGNTVTLTRHLVVDSDELEPPPTGNTPPVADAGGPYEVGADELFTLDGTGSSDADGDPLTYTWLLEGTHLAEGPTVPLRLEPGVYRLELLVHDGEATSTSLLGGPAVTTVTVSTYQLDGFDQPVSNDEVNHQTAGQDVPLKWRLSTALGPVTDPAAIESVTSRQHSCTDGAPVGPAEVAVGRPGVRHLAHGRWQLDWVTRRQWAGTCRTFTLALADGTTHSADFRFR